MSKVIATAKWSLELLAKRIASMRAKKFVMASQDWSGLSYDESQMMESDPLIRQQKSEIEYEC